MGLDSIGRPNLIPKPNFVHLNSAYFNNYDVVITTYGTLRNDIQLMAAFQFNYIILDESQIIKNADSQTAKNVAKLKSKYRLALTGTPLENSIEDYQKNSFGFRNTMIRLNNQKLYSLFDIAKANGAVIGKEY